MKKNILYTFIFLYLCSAASAASWRKSPWNVKSWNPTGGKCQILDKPKQDYSAGMSIIPSSKFGNFDDAAMVELDADWEFAYFRDVLYGDMDLNLVFRDTMFIDDADLDLPGLVAVIGVDAGWTWRYDNGMAIQARAHPGLYSDLKEIGFASFFMPFSGACIYSFSPEVSGIAGLQIRPSWELVVMPIIGVEWEICDELRLEAAIPRSRLIWYMNRDWQSFLSFRWQNITYKLDDAYDMVTLEDFRTTIGASYSINESIRVSGEIGSVAERSIKFDDIVNNNIHIDSTTFIRVGIGGPL